MLETLFRTSGELYIIGEIDLAEGGVRVLSTRRKKIDSNQNPPRFSSSNCIDGSQVKGDALWRNSDKAVCLSMRPLNLAIWVSIGLELGEKWLKKGLGCGRRQGKGIDTARSEIVIAYERLRICRTYSLRRLTNSLYWSISSSYN